MSLVVKTSLVLALTIIESNSTYFSDLDIARTRLLCTLFSAGIEKMRKDRNGSFSIALGAVSCSFRREIKPYEKFEMWTRVLAWDEKWLYVVTHFVREGNVQPKNYSLFPSQQDEKHSSCKANSKEEAIVASALSKCVFKRGRLTIPPEMLLQDSGLLPPRLADDRFLPVKTSIALLKRDIAAEILNSPFNAVERLDRICCQATQSPNPRRNAESGDTDALEHQAEERTWEYIERERRRGLKIADHLAGLDALDGEFTAEGEALGRCDTMWWS